MKRPMLASLLTIATIFVGGCSSGPSESAKQEALATYFKTQYGGNVEFTDFKTGECKKSDSSPGYACSIDAHYSATLKLGPGVPDRTMRDSVSGVFVLDKVGNDWKIVGRQQ
jgi:hypothetical protein